LIALNQSAWISDLTVDVSKKDSEFVLKVSLWIEKDGLDSCWVSLELDQGICSFEGPVDGNHAEFTLKVHESNVSLVLLIYFIP
jgi:hypothetical protein